MLLVRWNDLPYKPLNTGKVDANKKPRRNHMTGQPEMIKFIRLDKEPLRESGTVEPRTPQRALDHNRLSISIRQVTMGQGGVLCTVHTIPSQQISTMFTPTDDV